MNWATAAEPGNIDVAGVGLVAAVVAAVVSGVIQLAVITRRHRHELDAQRYDRLRALYQEYLRLVLGIRQDAWNSITQSNITEYLDGLTSARLTVAVGALLESSDAVRAALHDLDDAVLGWAESLLEIQQGESVRVAMKSQFESIVEPVLKQCADEMRKELKRAARRR